MSNLNLQSETEQRIVHSAEKLFCLKGRAGASMQDIADDAGINRTLLNYYFRTKDQLFEAVFRKTLETFVPRLAEMLKSDMPFSSYVDRFIGTVIDTMLANPRIPVFVLQELSSNPERMPQIIREMGIDPALAARKMEREGAVTGETPPDHRQLLLNILSLCIFPFAARSIVTELLYEGDPESFKESMLLRKKELPELMKRFMKQKPSS